MTVLVTLGDVGALDDALGTFLHAAVAGDGNFACGSVGPRDELPACSSAERAILKSHADSIRLRRLRGKVSALGKLWKDRVGQAFLPVFLDPQTRTRMSVRLTAWFVFRQGD